LHQASDLAFTPAAILAAELIIQVSVIDATIDIPVRCKDADFAVLFLEDL
jgi:hypothetical protein